MFGLRKRKIDVVQQNAEVIQDMLKVSQVLAQAEQELKYSPDAAMLDKKLHHLVFFCDGHMRKRYEHERMEDFEYKGTVFTRQRYFHWKRNLGMRSFTIPIIAPDDAKTLDTGESHAVLANPARIKGELYLIDTYNLKRLDAYRENGVKFRRKRETFLMPVLSTAWVRERNLLENMLGERLESGWVSNKNVYIVEAWMYEAVPEFWEDQLDGGYSYSPVRVFKPSKNTFGNYSFFTNLEYEHSPTYDDATQSI